MAVEILAVLLGGALLGALIGLVPILFGLFKKLFKLGLLGMAACIVATAILSWYGGVSICVLFVFLILKKAKED